MIDVKQYREQGYLYESIENYSDLINLEEYKAAKIEIDSIDYKTPSKYDYFYKYKDQSYMEAIHYSTFIKQDKDEECAKYVFNLAHRFYIDKMQRPELLPTWVFGTSLNERIMSIIHENVFKNFQKAFAEKYYSDKLQNHTGFTINHKLQFYDEGCEIKLHDDGQPKDRLCVFLYFLNNEWPEENGGHLILYTKDNKEIKIEPIFPNFVVLDSDVNLFHEVKIVNKGVKYNIVCFYAVENSNE
jgi:hypothetical protein